MLPVVNREKRLWSCVLVVEATGSRLEIVTLTRAVDGRIARVRKDLCRSRQVMS